MLEALGKFGMSGHSRTAPLMRRTQAGQISRTAAETEATARIQMHLRNQQPMATQRHLPRLPHSMQILQKAAAAAAAEAAAGKARMLRQRVLTRTGGGWLR